MQERIQKAKTHSVERRCTTRVTTIDLEVVKELVRRGADIYAKDIDGRTPCEHASFGGPLEKYMLQRYQTEIFEKEGRYVLLAILKQANYVHRFAALPIGKVDVEQMIAMLGYFVEQDPDSIRQRDGDGNLPIHVACLRLCSFSR